MSQAQFNGVVVIPKANIYFDGKVVSHSIILSDGSRKTLGLIYPGKFHFDTQAAESMEIIAGTCQVKIGDAASWDRFGTGQTFQVPSHSGFDIEVAGGICEYICSFIS